MAHKGPGAAPTYDKSQTSSLRIGILHSRWNSPIISALVNGCLKTLTESGVPSTNITTQSVPGAYELPFACQRMYTASQSSTAGTLASAANDLLGASVTDLTKSVAGVSIPDVSGPFDAIIAIGVLIKGSTMHFEYICDAVSHGLMRVQLDTGCPVIFGVLTCLTEEQAHTRAGIKVPEAGKVAQVSHGESGHNHGEDWGLAAVEMGMKRRGWGEGRFE